jgi:NAD dependent epimerase/dehydratase
MKNVLITGADGFIGSHLAELLVVEGYNVRALSKYNSFNNWGWLEDIDCIDKLEVISGDILDYNCCLEMTKDIEIVFHLAALIAIPYSYSAPSSYIDTNIKGTYNICQASMTNGVSRVVNTSTSEVYGTAQYVPIDEKHPTQPQSPYSASKIGSDAVAMSFYNSYNLQIITARPFNTYGPRQSARAVIPSIITQIANSKKQIQLGDITPTRDFNYVTDICKGFLQLANCKKAVGEIINIGSNYEISIGDTFDLIRKIMNSDVELILDEKRMRPSQSEVYRLWCDSAKIRQFTGYMPEFSFEEGLSVTVNWFTESKNLQKYKHGIYNI